MHLFSVTFRPRTFHKKANIDLVYYAMINSIISINLAHIQERGIYRLNFFVKQNIIIIKNISA